MQRIRADLKLRLLFLFLMAALTVLCYLLIREEGSREWTKYQDEFHVLYADLPASKAGLKQIFLPEANLRDLCTTCHMGIDNPLFVDAPPPFTTHPGAFLKQHKVNEFGCTLCHQGMGIGTTVAGAHGNQKNWPEPLIPAEYIQSICVGCHETPFMLEGAEELERGRKAFSQKGCYGCHAAPGFEDLPKVAGPLDGIGLKLSDPSWLYSWLKEPAALRPQTQMPNFKLTDDETRYIMAFLLSLEAGETPRPESAARAYPSNRDSTENGEILFVERGCRGCHSNQIEQAGVSPRVPNLAGIGLKVRAEWLDAWLEDPRAYNPEARMPKPTLTEAERLDLIAYLMTLRANDAIVKPGDPLEIDPNDVQKGKELVQIYGCYGCHSIKQFVGLPAPGVAVSVVAHKDRDELPFGDSDVPRTKWDWVLNKLRSPRIYETEDMPLRMPEFAHGEGEAEALTTFYLNNAPPDLPQRFTKAPSPRVRTLQEGDWLVETYNCRGCHMFEEDRPAAIAQHLQLKSMAPPRLIGEGERVQPQWLYDFLSRPAQLRPWLKIKMPDFGFSPGEAETLTDYFCELAAGAGVSFPYMLLPKRDDILQEEIEMGEYRVRTDKCVQCHPISLDGGLPGDIEIEDLSIDLMQAKNRLRFEWMKNFFRNPDKYAGADTKMPFVFYDPDGRPKIPDADMWIDVTAKYLMVMESVPEPAEEALEEIRPGSEVDWTDYD